MKVLVAPLGSNPQVLRGAAVLFRLTPSDQDPLVVHAVDKAVSFCTEKALMVASGNLLQLLLTMAINRKINK